MAPIRYALLALHDAPAMVWVGAGGTAELRAYPNTPPLPVKNVRPPIAVLCTARGRPGTGSLARLRLPEQRMIEEELECSHIGTSGIVVTYTGSALGGLHELQSLALRGFRGDQCFAKLSTQAEVAMITACQLNEFLYLHKSNRKADTRQPTHSQNDASARDSHVS